MTLDQEATPRHLALDPATGDITARSDTYLGLHGPFLWNDHLWFLDCSSTTIATRASQLPELPAFNPPSPAEADYAHIVKVERSTIEPVAFLPTIMGCEREPVLAHDILWGRGNTTDLRNGQRDQVSAAYETYQISEHEDDVWYFNYDTVVRARSGSDGIIADVIVEHTPLETTDPVGVKFWEGGYWVAGDAHDRPGEALRIDPESGDVLEVAPAEQFPAYHIDFGGYQLVLHDPTVWQASRLRTGDGQGWQLVDAATGETVATYDFGGYGPAAVIGETLWLIGDADTLAHLAVSDLIAAAAD